MRLSAPIRRLKRVARDQARAGDVPLHAALDKIAVGEGYSSWSLLAASQAKSCSNPEATFSSFEPGQLVLVAARPFQGKTVYVLHLALAAIAAGNEAYFFSLEYTARDVSARLATLPADIRRHADRLQVDCSDGISAPEIVVRLARASRGSFIVVDYLQLLDQKRTNPPLQDQVVALSAFARANGHILAFVCQIDRGYDPVAGQLPGPESIRLPNPLALRLFDRAIFLHGGKTRDVVLSTR